VRARNAWWLSLTWNRFWKDMCRRVCDRLQAVIDYERMLVETGEGLISVVLRAREVVPIAADGRLLRVARWDPLTAMSSGHCALPQGSRRNSFWRHAARFSISSNVYTLHRAIRTRRRVSTRAAGRSSTLRRHVEAMLKVAGKRRSEPSSAGLQSEASDENHGNGTADEALRV
jgi:hypothetical protein